MEKIYIKSSPLLKSKSDQATAETTVPLGLVEFAPQNAFRCIQGSFCGDWDAEKDMADALPHIIPSFDHFDSRQGDISMGPSDYLQESSMQFFQNRNV